MEQNKLMKLKNKKLFLLDMDGTIYLGNLLFDATPDFLAAIKRGGGRYMFLTNNSSRGVESYVQKLRNMGIEAEEDDFFTSAQATAKYLKKKYGAAKIYVFGTKSLFRELEGAGLNVTCELSDDISCLVAGFDTELTFKKLDDASRLLTKGTDFVATNPDYVCPTEYGYVPDCGSVCDMLYNATKRRPIVIGKPQPEMVYEAMEICGTTPKETIVVGDRIYTDVACGVNAGVSSALVLSGETTMEVVEQSNVKPEYIFSDIGEMLKFL